MGPTVSPYPNRGSRPVVLDMRRAGGESYASPTGLTQSFGGIDIGQAPPGMGHSELALTTSPLYHDRYGSSASSPVASGLGYRAPSSAYWNSATSSIGSVSPPSRSAYRDSNPLQGRDWGCRSVSETVQTPTGMYQGQSPTTDAPDRQIGYSNAQFDHSNPSGFGGLEAQTYPDLPGRASDGNVTGMRGDSSMSRGRVPAVTTEGPLSMDFGFRDSYQSNMTPPSSNYSRGGPVSASLEMATDRPLLVQGENMGEYPVPQLPAPMPASGGLSRPFPPPTSNRDPSSGSLGL
ncbi:hypothetical protein UVI_02030830 [Ustilaginoidea virens]|uniref:Uncharacterized protein n=1 Tax=Ustilaginoidea virens TaxID=1159556 RepID=A0A1B5L5S0_USTVR|nr:hypothetical protein UVI_02030830 [Ustilaginoidea virens]